MNNNSDDRIHVTRSTRLTRRGEVTLAVLGVLVLVVLLAIVGGIER